LRTTSNPARAATCAMPLPIWPEPITPTFLIIAAILPSHRAWTAQTSVRPFLHKHPPKSVAWRAFF